MTRSPLPAHFPFVAAMLLVTAVNSSALAADTYYFITVISEIPTGPPSESQSGPTSVAEVVSIESDSVPEPPPTPPDAISAFASVTLEELEQMGYSAPEEVLAQAEADGYASELSMDGWYLSAYLNASYAGSYLKRIQAGGKVWRDWYNPGPISHKFTCGTTQPQGLVSYDSGWLARWGWSINRYRDYTYPKTSTWTWWSQCYGTNRWDQNYPSSKTVYRTW